MRKDQSQQIGRCRPKTPRWNGANRMEWPFISANAPSRCACEGSDHEDSVIIRSEHPAGPPSIRSFGVRGSPPKKESLVLDRAPRKAEGITHVLKAQTGDRRQVNTGAPQ